MSEIPAKIHELIGRISMEWRTVEFALSIVAGLLLDLSVDQRRATLEHMRSKDLRGLITSLSATVKEPLSSELSSIAKRAKTLEERRNQITHDRWEAIEGEVERVLFTRESTLRFPDAITGIQSERQLEILMLEIQELWGRLGDASQRIMEQKSC